MDYKTLIETHLKKGEKIKDGEEELTIEKPVGKDKYLVKAKEPVEEGIKTMYHKFMAKRAGRKADDAYDMGDEEGFQKHVDDAEYHRVKAGGRPTRINTDPDAKMLTTRAPKKKGVREDTENIEEAVKLGSKVVIHAPGKSYHGKVGYVGEIRHGLYKGAPKTFTVDHEGGSIQLDKKNIRLHKESVEEAKVGDKVHVGHKTKGGAGVRGVVTKIDGDTVHIRSHEAEKSALTGKATHREYKGSLKNLTVESEEQIDELSQDTLKSYYKKRMDSFDRRKGITPGSKEHKQWIAAQKAADKAAHKSVVRTQARESKEETECKEHIDEISLPKIKWAIQARQKKTASVLRDPNASQADKIAATIKDDKELQRSYAKSQEKHIAMRKQNEETELEEQMKNPFDWKGYIEQRKKQGGTTSGATRTFHDVQKTDTGTRYTRQTDKEGSSKYPEAEGTVEAPKRGRGRPPGKYGSYKERSAETNAAAKAKQAASRAANKAKLKESFTEDDWAELVEDFTTEQEFIDFQDLLQCEEFEQLDELSKDTLASYYAKSIGDRHSKEMARDSAKRRGDEDSAKKLGDKAYNRSVGLEKAKQKFFAKEETEIEEAEELEELSQETLQNYRKKALPAQQKRVDSGEGKSHAKGLVASDRKIKQKERERERSIQGYNSKISGVAEEVEEIEELSKSTLGSYAKKASAQAAGLATTAMHHKNYSDAHAQNAAEAPSKALRKDAEKKSDQFAKYSFDATEKQIKRQKGVAKAIDRLTKEDVDLEESEILDEMQQGKEYKKDHIEKKIKSGDWEAVTDVKPGKHVELRHRTGKRVQVYVKEDQSLEESTVSKYSDFLSRAK